MFFNWGKINRVKTDKVWLQEMPRTGDARAYEYFFAIVTGEWEVVPSTTKLEALKKTCLKEETAGKTSGSKK